MGAYFATAVQCSPNVREAFLDAQESAQHQYGHRGYTGSLAEKSSAVFAGRLPARMTAAKFTKLTHRYVQWQDEGSWVDWQSDGGVTRRDDPTPKAMRTPEMRRLMKTWLAYAHGEKRGPAAAVELNKQESVLVKADSGRKGTRDKAFLIAGICAS